MLAPPPRRGLRRARERRVPREDRGRGRARRAARRRNPREAGKQQAIANSRKTTMDGSRKAAIAYYSHARRRLLGSAVEHVPARTRRRRTRSSTRSTTTSRTSTSRRATRPTRGASTSTSSRRRRTRSTSRTRTSRSASSSSTRRRAIRASGSRRKQAYQKVIAKPPPENKVYGYAWYKLAYVFWNKGDLPHALDAFKKTIDFGIQFAQLPERGEARRQRAQGRHPGVRARGQPDGRVQLLQEPQRRPGGLERQDVQDDGRPGPELPGHRSLSRGDRALQGPHRPRQRRATRRATTSRTSPKRRWR